MSETAVIAECPPTPETVELCPATPPERPSSANSLPLVTPVSPDHNSDSERSGSPINCSICLGRCCNKCFTDACMHYFCFSCLVEWSKIKAECPLCKKAFRSIIHNVKSENNYDEYLVQNQAARAQYPYDDEINIFLQDSRRFRYRTTLELRPHESNAIQQLFSITPIVPPASSRIGNIRTDGVTWRLEVYQRLLYACPLYDITGRFRECSAFFYRTNPAQIHRLMPWIRRELSALLQEDSRITYVTGVIEELLTRYNIYSREFREHMVPYLQLRTEHFIHEFINFARSPYDMIGYDRIIQYSPYYNSRVEPVVISSGASSSPSDFSDIEELDLAPRTEWTIETRTNNQTVIVSGFVGSADEVQVGTNGSGSGSGGGGSSSQTNNLTQTVNLNILSDTDSDECVFVKAEKPPHLRTPELVSLNSESDSDCIVIDNKDNEIILPSTSNNCCTTEQKPKIEEIIDYSMPSTSRGIGTGSKPSTSAGLYYLQNNVRNTTELPLVYKRGSGKGFKRIFEESTSSNNSSESESSHEEYKIYNESKRKKSPSSLGSSPMKIIRKKKKHLTKKKENKSDSDSSKPKKKLKSKKRVRSVIKDKLTKTIVYKHFTKKNNLKKNILSTSSSSNDSD